MNPKLTLSSFKIEIADQQEIQGVVKGVMKTWVWVLFLSIANCEMLGQLFNNFGSWFPHQLNGNNTEIIKPSLRIKDSEKNA